MTGNIMRAVRLEPELAGAHEVGPMVTGRVAASRFALAVGLALIAVVGLALRLVWLWPPVRGVTQAPYDDEGVYVMAAQMWR